MCVVHVGVYGGLVSISDKRGDRKPDKLPCPTGSSGEFFFILFFVNLY